MTEFLEVAGGRIAYDVTGEGPLVVLSHGIGDRRQAYRFLAPRLAQAGYRVASADLRGHGESSMGWKSVTGADDAITHPDIAGDLLALIRHLGGPAVVVGHSISGGAATIAAVQEPDLVSAIVEINPFTKKQSLSLVGLLRIRRYRQGLTRLITLQLTKSLGPWLRYLDVAYPTKPADYDDYITALVAKLREPGRMAEFMKTGKSKPAETGARLPDVRCPALVVMGTLDPDFADPQAEGDAIVAAMPAGTGTVAMVGGGGHYIHAQSPDEVAALVIPFLKEHARA
ncbi:MAG TPA: alpha/beta hydrolase [Streptosporangiaceae bacterium]|nr:alpha/beta hydrolase [Streptosporangiaceae bacterium]